MTWSADRGAELRRRRENAGVSRRALARAVGCTIHDIVRWETSAYGPGLARWSRVERVLSDPAAPGPARVTPNTRWPLADRFDGARLRELRRSAGLGLAALARRLGTDEPRLWLWETGRRAPGAHYAAAICAALGCAPEDLCTPRPDMKPAVTHGSGIKLRT